MFFDVGLKQSSIRFRNLAMLNQVVGVNDPTALAVVLTDVNSQLTIANGQAAPGRLAGRSNYQAAPGRLSKLTNENGQAAPGRLRG